MTIRPRQLRYRERQLLAPLTYTVTPDRKVAVPRAWQTANLRPLVVRGVGIQRDLLVHQIAEPIFRAWLRLCHESDILTIDGAFVPRLRRSVTVVPEDKYGPPNDKYGPYLSMHTFGLAIDLNARWNPRGKPGPVATDRGTVARLVDAAASIRHTHTIDGEEWGDLGIVCGAHWSDGSCDPMHFEIGAWDA